MNNLNIYEMVRKMEKDDRDGMSQLSEYVEWNMREEINRVEAYVNSKHISGEVDHLGRDKPFFNIVTSAINIWDRATDIDRKNIKIRAGKKTDIVPAFLASVLIQDWMRKDNFGMFLNKWGRTLAKFGSCILKFVEKDGELCRNVMDWNYIICDPNNFYSNPVVEILYYTPYELKAKIKNGYDEELVNRLLDDLQSQETSKGKKKNNRNNYIKIYEIHGNLPVSFLTDKEEDEDKYTQQMHVISFIQGKESGQFDDYTLFKGREAKNPYILTHLMEEEGRTLSIGCVSSLFDSQWMVNHNQKLIKDQLDLASKVFFQTADDKFLGRNAIQSIENGDIMVHSIGNPITQVNSSSHDIGSMMSSIQDWMANSNRISGTPESMMGDTAPSGTAWRQVEALLQESHSLFEKMVENKSMYLENIFREYVIPYIKKKMDTKEEIGAILEDHDIKKFDKMFIPKEITRQLNDKIKQKVLNTSMEDIESGNILDANRIGEMEEQVRGRVEEGLGTLGNQRFIKPDSMDNKTWKEALKDLEWELDIDISGEAKDNQSNMATLSTLLQVIAGQQGQPMSDDMRLVFNKILELTGVVSPIELNRGEQQPQQAQPMPQMQPQQMQ